ncbi:MAG: DUF5702 domain-containing protein [Clostridium sp.]|nr:DUF5702 domain-containing protein [Acetatifactor muris]MCM1527796.1 DUF5702 domain-containing protein [Bacteroides sp.]MCM1563891.1 DUF5702 domain-containing protein [Clostridium sp.]
MRRKDYRGSACGAYLTVYLSLVLSIILSLCLTLIEGTRKGAIFLEAECVTDIGLNSILAEYHRELLTQYNLFAIDSSYGRTLPRTEAVKEHLEGYIRKNLSGEDVFLDWLLYRDFLGLRLQEADVTKVSFLTDAGGALFRRRAAETVWDDWNADLFQELQGWLETVESEGLTEQNVAERKAELDRELASHDGEEKQISEKEWITIEVNNPTDFLEEKRRAGILNWVLEDPEALSGKRLSTENLIMSRMEAGALNEGNMEQTELTAEEKLLERFLFQEYLLRYMGHYGAESGEDALAYQVEYLLIGDESDTDNLKGVVNIIFAIREAANTSYLLSDQEKSAMAEALGSLLASAMGIPEASQVLKFILLFGWAFAESIYDVKCLMAGEEVPLIKTSDTWHYGLENVLSGQEPETYDGMAGLDYKDYLRILLMLQPEDLLTARAMNMVEADIRQTPGNEFFRLDGCVDCVEACVTVESAYGYNCEITRRKGYGTF